MPSWSASRSFTSIETDSASVMSHEYTHAWPPRRSTSAFTCSSASVRRATRIGTPPAAATWSAVASPIPDDAPVITTRRPWSGPPSTPVAGAVAVEVLLPVVPEHVRVPPQLRHLDAGAGERGLRARRVEGAVEGDVRQHLRRDPELIERDVAREVGSRDARRAAAPARPARPERAPRQQRDQPRRARRLGERVEHRRDRLRLRRRQVERLAVEARRVDQVVHGVGDVVDRDDVRVAEVGRDDPDRATAGWPAVGSSRRGSRGRRSCRSRR